MSNIKKCLSVFIALLFIFSIIPNGLLTVFAKNDYSSLTPEEYMVNVILNNNYSGYYSLSGNTTGQSEIKKEFYDINVMSMARRYYNDLNTDALQKSIKKWKIATFEVSSVADKKVKEEEYYEAILLSILDKEVNSDKVLDAVNTSYTKTVLSLSKDTVKFISEAKNENIANINLKAMNTNYLSTAEMENLLSAYTKNKETVSICKHVGDFTSDFSLVLKSCSTVYDVVATISKYAQLANVTDGMINVLYELWQNATNDAMRNACKKVYETARDKLKASEIALIESKKAFCNNTISYILDQCWDLAKDAIIKAIGSSLLEYVLIGRAAGKAIGNFVFSTDSMIEQFYALEAMTHFEADMKISLVNCEVKYRQSPSQQNANTYLSALQLYFSMLCLGNDYATEYEKIRLTSGAYNTIVNLFSKEKTQLLSNFSSMVSNINKSINTTYTFLANFDSYLKGYEVDAPSGYEKYCNESNGSSSSSSSVTPTVQEIRASTSISATSKASKDFDPIWPCKNSYCITCLYYYKMGNQHGSRWGKTHAMDVGGSTGDVIYAVEDGVVETAANQGNTSFGKYVVISHSNGSKTLYGHLNSYCVSKGQTVSKGQQIGNMGSTGNSTGPHLHFEISNADPWKDYFHAKYYACISFEQNVRSNNVKYNTDQTIVNAIDYSYTKKGSYYYFNGREPNCTYTTYTVEHTPGTYTVHVNSSLNIRSTPSTSLKSIGSLYNGDKIQITEFSGNWGKCDLGWVCLDYVSYSGPLEPVIKVPSAPVLSLKSDVDIPSDAVINVSWNSVDNADCYDAYLVNSSGIVCQQQLSITTTTANFIIGNGSEGTYSIYVNSRNSKYTSEKSNSVTIKVHDPLIVRFVNDDGSPLSTQTVRYGENAVVPPSPSKYGFTFAGWSGTYSNVKTNQTVTATYTRNKYTVRFFDDNGKLIDTQKVYYEYAATAPDWQPNAGYREGWHWDKSFDYIEKDTDINAVVKWYDDDMTCIVSDLSAIRDSDGTGVTITYKLNNQKGSITSARAIVSLKTSSGKLVTTTESAAFSIKNNVTKTQEQFIPTTGAATVAEVYIVANYKTAIPISITQQVVIDQGTMNWSSWSTTKPSGDDVFETQSRTEYRYRDKKFETSSKSSMSGWTLYDSKITSYGSTQGPVYSDPANGLRKTWTEQYVTSYTPTRIQYFYSRYVNYAGYIGKSNSNGAACYGYSAGAMTYYQDTGWLDSPLHDSGSSSTSDNGRCYGWYDTKYDSQGLWWFNQKTRTVGGDPIYSTRWYYQEPVYTYYFWQWGNWTEWSTNSVSANDNRQVEKRTVYRYRTNDLVGIEDNTGVERTVTGSVDKVFAGKDALLMVYKVDEASDYSNQYVKQLKIGNDGTYSVKYTLLSEPTVESGDYSVTLGIVGTNTVYCLDKIEAPKPVYTVNFYDDNGNLVSSQEVTDGENAIVPDAPEKEGYRFVYWDHTGTNIKDNTDIFAHYEKLKFTVVFVNWSEETVNVQNYEYGDILIPPVLNDTDESKVIGWDKVIDENTVVTENMVITAKYEAKTFNVKFLDFDNNVISSQTVEYGESADIPAALEEEDYYFFNWSSEVDLDNVTADTIVVPIYEFEETVEMPVMSLDNGSYNGIQTLSITCPTEDAVIYYTLDGSEPNSETAIEYTGPVKINETCIVNAIACSFHKNDSEITTRYIAINGATGLSKWVSYDKIPSYVLNNLGTYHIYDDIGYRYKEETTTDNENIAKTLISSGWTETDRVANAWSDWQEGYPSVIGLIDPEIEEKEPEPIPTQLYSYTRWKYENANGTVVYSSAEITGKDCKEETLKLKNKLSISAFDGKNKVYSYNGENWYNQSLITEDVIPEYNLYRYRSNTVTYSTWSDWTTDKPGINETREYQTGEVYQYDNPEQYVVTLVNQPDEVGYRNIFFNVSGTTLMYNVDENQIYGYNFEGMFKNADFTEKFDIDNDLVTSDITLYLKWTPKTYTVTFKGFNGEIVDTQNVKYLDFAIEPDFPEVSGYVFFGVDKDICDISENIVVNGVYVIENSISKIKLNKDNITLFNGNSTCLSADVESEDNVQIVWISLNPDIVEVDDTGNIKAVSTGSATIIASSDDYCYPAYCTVDVINDVNQEITLKTGSTLGLDDARQLRGISVGKNTVTEIKTQIQSKNVSFTDKDGNILADDALVGTGTVICIKNGDTIVDSVIAVMTGDTNGDGKVNNRDVAYLTRYLVYKEVADLQQLTAMDTNGDGKVNNRDSAMLARYLVGKETL